jgi:FtsP/CotA-like multicopper oxidase with cupredoxin domain
MVEKNISRRDMLRILGLGGITYFVTACKPVSSNQAVNLPAAGEDLSPPDLEIILRAVPDRVQIFPGKKTTVWRYQGEVVSGPANSLIETPDSYLGPSIHVQQGQILRIHFQNELPEPSIIHWHGLHVPPAADGHPRLVIDPGEIYTYDFKVLDRAGTYWYHPHPHSRTAVQVYAGLAGLFIVHDQEEEKLGLPTGEFDLPLVIQDRDFDQENQLVYGAGQMMDRMVGFLGRQILVNGRPDLELPLSARPYRLRLLNGSNSRIYKLAWDDETPLTVLGTDGGLLETPIQKEYLVLAPAQRIDIWADFSQDPSGKIKNLVSLPFEGFGGQGAFSVVRVKIGTPSENKSVLPDKLAPLNYHDVNQSVNLRSPRAFRLAMAPGMVWTLNGRTFGMEDVAPDEIVRLNDLEVWEFENRVGSGMGMMGSMALPHPMHLHGLQFQILEREISSSTQEGWNTLSAGFIDQGWHDTVLVYPGEKVKILVKFEDFPGLYLYHCHNLEHEDMGMMRNYLVKE